VTPIPPHDYSADAATLVRIIEASPSLMSALHAVQLLGLKAWCIGAGAIRARVWDELHGYSDHTATPDIDVAYFDASCDEPATEQALRRQLSIMHPEIPWELTNQAKVHLWYEKEFGYPIKPLPSLLAGIAAWPEVATAVGVCLDAQSRLTILAPFGLEDLFAMVIRHNPTVANAKIYADRIDKKQFALRWPKVRILPSEFS